jgi:hypothetical protein
VNSNTNDSVDTDVRQWDDPDRCVFCEAPLTDGGPGFVRHIETAPDCAAAFDLWRSQVAADVGGEWSG